MSHFAIFAPPLKGHYGPYSSLAAELIRRGHQATFVHHEHARPLVEVSEAKFAPVGRKSAPLAEWTRPMARIRGLVGLGDTIRRMEEFTTMLCREAPQVLRRHGVDVVIADQLEPAGGLVAEHLGLPWITIATTLPMNKDEAIPPPFVGWAYDPSAKGLRRNRSGWFVSDLVLRSFNTAIARNARELGLSPRRTMEACFSSTLQLSQMVAGLDFPRSQRACGLAYTGPLGSVAEEEFALPRRAGRPMAYCTLGTLQGARAGLFRKIADACHRSRVELVLTHGRQGDRRALKRLPGNPLVYDWLPQREVLKQVDFVICHGGMITVLDALSVGLPILVIPLAFEQPGIAARVVRSGAGLMLSKHATPRAISHAVARLKDEPDFRMRAMELQAEISAAGGVVRAADLIEISLSGGAPKGVSTTVSQARDDVRGDSRSGSRSAGIGSW